MGQGVVGMVKREREMIQEMRDLKVLHQCFKCITLVL